MNTTESITDFTKQDFTDLVKYASGIFKVHGIESAPELIEWITELSEYPETADLFQQLTPPEQIVVVIDEWRNANNKPTFKTEVSLVERIVEHWRGLVAQPK
jgi:hypothetical protein